MTTRTRKPKQPKKTRNVKKDTVEIVSTNLKLYVDAATKAAFVYSSGYEKEVQVLKRIRIADVAVNRAQLAISKMRVSIWRDEMLSQLKTHGDSLEEKWNFIVEGDEE